MYDLQTTHTLAKSHSVSLKKHQSILRPNRLAENYRIGLVLKLSTASLRVRFWAFSEIALGLFRFQKTFAENSGSC